MKRTFRFSRFLHKWLGITVCLYFIWMSITGIIINHPYLFANFSVPASWLDKGNLKRFTWRGMIFSKKNPLEGFAYGDSGILKTVDGGRRFSPFMKGLPHSIKPRKVHCLYLDEANNLLFAGTESGIYICDLKKEIWRGLMFEGKGETILDIFPFKHDLLAISHSHFYLAKNRFPFGFKRITLKIDKKINNRSTISDFLLSIHHGLIFGLLGKLLIDLVGIVLLFLSVSAIYFWYFPHIKCILQGRKRISLYKFLRKYHSKLGIWTVIPILLVSITGFFVSFPPMRFILAYPLGFNPKDILNRNPWKENIEKALYNPDTEKVLILTKDGLMEWDGDLKSPCKKVSMKMPPRFMETSVFRYNLSDKTYLIGSFSGLYKIDPLAGKVVNYLFQKTGRRKTARIFGYFKKPNGDEYYCDCKKGIITINGNNLITMPEGISKTSIVSLWDFCYELHCGRIFKFILGQNSWLIALIGSLSLIFTGITGTYNWFYRRR